MTLDFTIGNAELCWNDERKSGVEAVVKIVSAFEAPAFTGSMMSRNRSYLSIPWGSHDADFFLELFGFKTVMNDREFVQITPALVERLKGALADYPDVTPQFNDDDTCGRVARLMVAIWWCEWALSNCTMPAIEKS